MSAPASDAVCMVGVVGTGCGNAWQSVGALDAGAAAMRYSRCCLAACAMLVSVVLGFDRCLVVK